MNKVNLMPFHNINMNLRQQISKFRSQILIGKYDSALSLGKLLVSRLELLQHLGLITSDQLKLTIQEEYEKCLTLNNRIHYRQVLKEQGTVKKWGSKNQSQDKGKWKKKEENPKHEEIYTSTTPPKIPKSSKEIKIQSSPIDKLGSPQISKFLQLLETEILMPIKMPSFYKQKNTHFRVITLRKQHRQQIINYFTANDFIKTQLSFIRNELINDDKNFFAEASLQEILVECGSASLQQVMQLKPHPKLKQCHLVCVICSEKVQLQLI